MQIMPETGWCKPFSKMGKGKLRLFCFPYGGGTSEIFRLWPKQLPDEIELVAIELPGHGTRAAQPFITDWQQLITELYSDFVNHIDKPYVIFGHSLGACIAFSLLQKLQECDDRLPEHLFVSACNPPDVYPFEHSIHDLSDEAMFEFVFNINPRLKFLAKNSDEVKVLSSLLKSDLLLAETWDRDTEIKLNVSISTLVGVSDTFAPPENMETWKNYTSKEYSYYLFQGDHFFLEPKRDSLLNLIKAKIEPLYKQRQSISEMYTQPTSTQCAEKNIIQQFEQQVKNYPDSTAVICDDKSVTYQTLNSMTNKLAQCLIDKGVKRQDRVAISMQASIDMIVTIIAILKVGGIYLPLDKRYPKERVEFMLSDANASIVITNGSEKKFANSHHYTIYQYSELYQKSTEQISEAAPEVTITNEDIAYINYTSGSTGKPKGVAIPHRAVVSLVCDANFADFSKSAVFLQHSPIGFDAATFEIWGALLNGAQCVIYPKPYFTLDVLHDVIHKHSITTTFFTSSLFNLIIDENPSVLEPMKQVLVGGEALSVAHIRKALNYLPNTELINGYGPTECTTFSITHKIHCLDASKNSIPLGVPTNNTYITICSQNANEGDYAGEILIGGTGLARGYLNNKQLTDEKFIVKKNIEGQEVRLYRTGDKGQFNEDGTIEFLGRLDNQVKINGFRIEIEEIENALVKHDSISQAAIIISEHLKKRKQIIAFIVPANDYNYDSEILTSYLANQLPQYMLPEHVYCINKLPITSSEKLDRVALNKLYSEYCSDGS